MKLIESYEKLAEILNNFMEEEKKNNTTEKVAKALSEIFLRSV